MDAQNNARVERNQNGGLALIPMPGFESLALETKTLIEKNYPDKVDIATPRVDHHKSGEPFIELPKDHIGGHDCFLLTSGPGTELMLAQTQIALAYLVGRKAKRITLVSGYSPLSRSDKDDGLKVLALNRIIIDMFWAASYQKLERMIVANLHSPGGVAAGRPGLITEISLARRVIKKAIKDAIKQFPDRNICLLFPDESALKRVEREIVEIEREMSRTFHIICGRKRRKSSDDITLAGFSGDLDKLDGSIVISVDDEIATGNTNIKTAKAFRSFSDIKAFWATVIHFIGCGNCVSALADVNCPIDRIYATDTIPIDNRYEITPLIDSGRLVILRWARDLFKIIRYSHWDMSIREIR